ncbi:MAG: hypothetical protein ABW217_23100 [Polyangiaceae bacterium]
MFPLHLAPPPLIAPCSESPLPEPAAPSSTTRVQWADVDAAHDPELEVSLVWASLQLVPSPQLGVGDDGALFGLRWQLTPLLYSFATDARLDRFRWFIAEPVVRQSGSLELFVSPEYLALDGGVGARFGVRAGVRSYFGLIARGEYLSVSLGSSYFRFRDHEGVAYEAGAYILFGSLGVQLTYAPGFDAASWLTTLRLRYF